MTLIKSLLTSVMLIGSFAQADMITTGKSSDSKMNRGDYGIVRPDLGGHHDRRNSDYDRPIYPEPGRGGNDYGPIRPYPGDRHDDRFGRRQSEEIYVGRYVRNESIDLLRELSHLRGSRVESIRVYVDRSREVAATLDLYANGRSEDSRRVDIGRAVTLAPRNFLEIGRQLRSLEVYARGEMLIDRIVVELSSEAQRPPPPPPPYGDGYEIVVDVHLPSYLPPQPRLDITPYIDIRRYRGYEIQGVEITAVAQRSNASLEVLMNGFLEGRMLVSQWQSTQVIRSRQNLVLGSSFGSLVLAPRGDSNIIRVRLILSR